MRSSASPSSASVGGRPITGVLGSQERGRGSGRAGRDERARGGPRGRRGGAVELTELEQQARTFARDSRAASTWRSLRVRLRTTSGPGAPERRPPLESLPATPATVALYLRPWRPEAASPPLSAGASPRSASLTRSRASTPQRRTPAFERCGPASAGIKARHPARCALLAPNSSPPWWLRSATAWPRPGTARCCCSASPGAATQRTGRPRRRGRQRGRHRPAPCPA